jgi:hypothetical protein
MAYGGKKAYAMHLISSGYWPRKTKEGGVYLADDAQCLKGADEVSLLVVDSLTGMCSEFARELTTQSDTPGFKLSYRVSMGGDLVLGGMDQGHYGIIQQLTRRIVGLKKIS